MLLSCEYQGVPCSYSDFYYYRDYYYGNCFRFNGGELENQTREDIGYIVPTPPVRKSSKIGWRNGLRLEWYIGDQISQQQYTFKSGIRLIVHNQSYTPFPFENGIDVATGLQTNVAISRSFTNRLPYPYSNCIDELNEKTSSQNEILAKMYEKKRANQIKVYQQEYCMKICFQYYAIQACKCSSPSLKFLNVTTNETYICATTEEVNCITSAEYEFYNREAVNDCYSKCPIECNTIDYNLKVSTADFPTNWFVKMEREHGENYSYYYFYDNFAADYTGPTKEILKETTVMLNVFYDSM